MTISAALEKLLKSYSGYYNVNRESPAEPFIAEAEFNLHNEQYFLMRSAKLSEANSREFVFFAVKKELDEASLMELDEKAWEIGLSRVEAGSNHRNSDVALIVLTEHLTPEASAFAKRARHYKSYRFGLHGWSNYRLIVHDLSTGEIAHNRQGEILKKVISNNLL